MQGPLERKPYGVVESDRFTAHLSFMLPVVFARWEEIKETLDLDLALSPRAFEAIPGTGLYAVGLRTNPALTVYFSVDDEKELIVLEDIFQPNN
ncbi:MAG: hypothetical protein IT364_12115 [Candidatus Hydrogenedentes bacterium]|nr:hypothetical protein [Candidatus Hydrogenedentota bacterium]